MRQQSLRYANAAEPQSVNCADLLHLFAVSGHTERLQVGQSPIQAELFSISKDAAAQKL